MKNTKLIIIAGVTGSIGQELLRKYLVEQNTLIYGISRKGVQLGQFSTLPNHHLMVQVNLFDSQSIKEFVKKIPANEYESITYFHLVGEFKTEINSELDVRVENDLDNDGINDSVYGLVTSAYKAMVSALLEMSDRLQCEVNIASYGSLADQHAIECFTSYRKSREAVKSFSRDTHTKHPRTNFYLFNTSTILAADEMIERPYIFATVVNPVYWITPLELTNKSIGFMQLQKGYVEEDIYLSNPHFSIDYFCNDTTYRRRVKELFNKNV